jgi:hypothetical protein
MQFFVVEENWFKKEDRDNKENADRDGVRENVL